MTEEMIKRCILKKKKIHVKNMWRTNAFEIKVHKALDNIKLVTFIVTVNK